MLIAPGLAALPAPAANLNAALATRPRQPLRARQHSERQDLHSRHKEVPDRELVGMDFEDARRRVLRIAAQGRGDATAKENLISSIVNQIRLRYGEGAVQDVMAEIQSVKVW